MSGRGRSGSFVLPTDGEHKATVFKPWVFKGVHMQAFHASWMSFFVAFMSTFAPAALIPLLREDLNLTKSDVANAGIAAVTGNVAARVILGTLCDTLGPRYGHACSLLLTAPCVFGIGLIRGPMGFIVCRFVIGFSLATFVACQFWSSVMFSVQIVGTANGTGAGWGNLGGGVAQFLMPLVYSGFRMRYAEFTAWRFSFWFPGTLHIVMGFVVLAFARDLPDGTYAQLQKSGRMKSPKGGSAFWMGVLNYRAWILTLLYGCSFGVELTMNNIVVEYFFDQFDVDLARAGVFGSIFGLMNIFARPLGGWTSDKAAKHYGMQGRLWFLWAIQTTEGLLCTALGFMHGSLFATLVVMACFSVAVQAAEGASYGVVPFVSKRALGVVSGLVGAGGNLGSSLSQFAFFKQERMDTSEGITWMGVSIVVGTVLIAFIYFPMWGGMFWGPTPGVTEEDYYLREYTKEEISQGLAMPSIVFAAESRCQRGRRRLEMDAAAKNPSFRTLSTRSDIQLVERRSEENDQV